MYICAAPDFVDGRGLLAVFAIQFRPISRVNMLTMNTNDITHSGAFSRVYLYKCAYRVVQTDSHAEILPTEQTAAVNKLRKSPDFDSENAPSQANIPPATQRVRRRKWPKTTGTAERGAACSFAESNDVLVGIQCLQLSFRPRWLGSGPKRLRDKLYTAGATVDDGLAWQSFGVNEQPDGRFVAEDTLDVDFPQCDWTIVHDPSLGTRYG